MERKPLGQKCYGSIPHLPGSRLGPSDKQAQEGQVIIATQKKRDKYDEIFISEKLDGSNVGVTKLLDGSLVPLTRKGYEATSSPFEQHKYWAVWVWENSERFDQVLHPGEWCVGEWCIQAHGTRYIFKGEPFFLFDIFLNQKRRRASIEELYQRNALLVKPFGTPALLEHTFKDPIDLETIKLYMEDKPYGEHGAVDPIEGYVWRVERKGIPDFLVKYVRPDKEDGIYLPEQTGDRPVYNYWEDSAECIEHLRDTNLKEKYENRRQSRNNPKQNVIKRRSIR